MSRHEREVVPVSRHERETVTTFYYDETFLTRSPRHTCSVSYIFGDVFFRREKSSLNSDNFRRPEIDLTHRENKILKPA